MSESTEPHQKDRQWLVERRNKIQTLMMRLLARYPTPEKETPFISARAWQIAVGAAFALWRAVFLMLPETEARSVEGPLPAAKQFLEKLIDTNAIAFADEARASTWTCGFYLLDAAWRIEQLMKQPMWKDLDRQLARNAWDSCYDLLRHGVENGFPIDKA